MPGMLQINDHMEGQGENVETSQKPGHVGSDELLHLGTQGWWDEEAGNSKGINTLTSWPTPNLEGRGFKTCDIRQAGSTQHSGPHH